MFAFLCISWLLYGINVNLIEVILSETNNPSFRRCYSNFICSQTHINNEHDFLISLTKATAAKILQK